MFNSNIKIVHWVHSAKQFNANEKEKKNKLIINSEHTQYHSNTLKIEIHFSPSILVKICESVRYHSKYIL